MNFPEIIRFRFSHSKDYVTNFSNALITFSNIFTCMVKISKRSASLTAIIIFVLGSERSPTKGCRVPPELIVRHPGLRGLDGTWAESLMGFFGIEQIEGHEIKGQGRDRERKREGTSMIYEHAGFLIDGYHLSLLACDISRGRSSGYRKYEGTGVNLLAKLNPPKNFNY